MEPDCVHPTPDQLWEPALSAVVAVAETNPDQISLSDVEAILDAVHTDQIKAATGLLLSTIFLREREAIREAVAEEIEALLLARSDQLPESEHATELAKCFGSMAGVAPIQVLDAVPALASAATSASPSACGAGEGKLANRIPIYSCSKHSAPHPGKQPVKDACSVTHS